MAESLFDLGGSVALVVGGAEDGLALESAVVLAEHGADVFLMDLPDHVAELEEARRAVEAAGRRAEVACGQTSDAVQVDGLIAQAIARFGHLDVVVHHTVVAIGEAASAVSLAEWRHVVDVGLAATWLVNRRAAREMARSGRGKIVDVVRLRAPDAAGLPQTTRHALRTAVADLSRVLAVEWGPSGVRVNAIVPPLERAAWPPSHGQVGARRHGRPEGRSAAALLDRPTADLEGAEVFLASPASDHVTGQVLFVDGV